VVFAEKAVLLRASDRPKIGIAERNPSFLFIYICNGEFQAKTLFWLI
jgi:hypothetical protein